MAVTNDRMRPDLENLLRQGLVEMKSIPHEDNGFPPTAYSYQERTPLSDANAKRRQRSGAIPRIYETPRSPSRCGPLPALSKSGREDRRPGRSKPSRRSRLRIEEASLSRSREARRRPQFRLRQTCGPSPTRTDFEVVRGKIPVPDVRIEYETLTERARSRGPRTCHRPLSRTKSRRKSPRRILALRPCRRCFKAQQDFGSA